MKMRAFVFSYLVTAAISFAGLKIFHLEAVMISFFSGAALGVLNVAALYFTWKKILEKKNLVLSVSVIVFKYPLLGFILYAVVQLKQISLGWFMVGMGSFLPAVLFSLIFWFAPKKQKEISLKIED